MDAARPAHELVEHLFREPERRLAPKHGTLHEWSKMMSNYLFIYRRSRSLADEMTPEQRQQHMEKWKTWIGAGLQKGWLLDAGDGLTQEGRVVNSKKVITDGPLVESKEIVGGFSIVQAASIQAAAELAKGCPVLLSGGTVEVRQLAGLTEKL